MRTILASAVDLARNALLDLEPTGVGPHLGVCGAGDCAATHRFEATLPGYHGWQWAVVVAAAPDTERVTVSESALLPGPDALIPPEFVPWDQRIRPGDLAPGDLLAPPPEDPRLVPGYLATGDPEVDETAQEVGLGRRQVLSREGRHEAAERWYAQHGPDSEMAKAAPASCASCGFFLPLAGALRAAFGVCGNAMGADGRVVHQEYGCGAHSDTELPHGAGSPAYQAYDDAAVEVVRVDPNPAVAATEPAAADAAEPSSEQLRENTVESSGTPDTQPRDPAGSAPGDALESRPGEVTVPSEADSADSTGPGERGSSSRAVGAAEPPTGTQG